MADSKFEAFRKKLDEAQGSPAELGGKLRDELEQKGVGGVLQGLVRGGLNFALGGHAGDVGNYFDPEARSPAHMRNYNQEYAQQAKDTPGAMGLGGGAVLGGALGKLLGGAAGEAAATPKAPVDAPFVNSAKEALQIYGPNHPITRTMQVGEAAGRGHALNSDFERPSFGTTNLDRIKQFLDQKAHQGGLFGKPTPDSPIGTAAQPGRLEPTEVGGNKTVEGGKDWAKWEEKVQKEKPPDGDDDEDDRF